VVALPALNAPASWHNRVIEKDLDDQALGATGLAQGRKLTADDYIEIQQLYAQYNIAIDSGHAEGYAATFTPDGVFNTSNGHDALVRFIHRWRETMKGAKDFAGAEFIACGKWHVLDLH
jgi:hypothetical protein